MEAYVYVWRDWEASGEGYLEGVVGVCAVDELVQSTLGMIEHLRGDTERAKGDEMVLFHLSFDRHDSGC